jgi:hypothetical protein
MIHIDYKLRYSAIVVLTTALLSSCIYDGDAGCMQYIIKPVIESKGGVQQNDTTVKIIKAYLFRDGKYEREVEPESNGSFIVDFTKGQNSSLSLFGYPSADSLNEITPKTDDAIASSAVTLSALTGNTAPRGLYYGRFDYTQSTPAAKGKEISVAMLRERASVHVVVENLTEMYSSGGDYRIELSGLRNAASYDGTIGGDSVTYVPDAAVDNKNNLCSKAECTLPTKQGEGVTVTIYRNNSLIWQSSKDAQGNEATLLSGDDKALIVDIERRNAGFQVMQWSDYVVSTVIN